MLLWLHFLIIVQLGLDRDGELRAVVLCYICFADSELKIIFKQH